MKSTPKHPNSVLLLLATILCFGRGALAATPWYPFGPDGGDARSFAQDPHDPAHIYLGTTNGWIYDSADGGRKWRRLARVGRRDDLVLDNIVVDAGNPRHILVGAWVIDHPDGGLYVSNDSGHTWSSQSEMRGQSIRSLTDAPSDPKTVVAGTLTGVYRSVDSGAHWALISPAGSKEIHEVESLAIDPHDPAIIYAGTWHLPWKTVDGGEHWNSIKEGIIEDSDVFSIIVDPKEEKIVYASACSGIYKSVNGGEKFVKVEGIPTGARRTRVLMQDPVHLETVFAGTTEGLFRTPDAGKTWVRTTGAEVIVNDVYVDPSNGDHVLIATDRGGVLLSDDGGFTFRSSNAGFSERQVTAYAADSNSPSRIYVGVVNDKEAGGVFVSEDGGLSWEQRSTGLGGRDVFSLAQGPDGSVVAGTGHGIFVLRDEVWSPAGTEAAVTQPLQGSAANPVGPTVKKATAKPPVTKKGAAHQAPMNKSVAKGKKPVVSKKNGAKPMTLAARRRAQLRGRSTAASRAANERAVARAAAARVIKPTVEAVFSGAVYAMTVSNNVLLAATSNGVLHSNTSGATWGPVPSLGNAEWRSIASSGARVIAAGLHDVAISKDSGTTWTPIAGPEKLKQLAAVAVTPDGEIWVGGLEGAFYSRDDGATWRPVENTYVVDINSLYYDEAGRRMLMTADTTTTYAVSVHLPDRIVTRMDTGWNLRFLRPVGDHLLAATLFDGVVVQPRMVISSDATAH